LKVAALLLAAGAICTGPSAWAATQLSLTYVAPAGTASPTDVIPIRVSLENVGATAFEISNGSIVQGLDLGVFSPNLVSGYTLADIAYAVPTQFVGCEGTFNFTPCSTGPSDYQFNVGPRLPVDLVLNPGEATTLDIGSLVPVSTNIAEGQYTISNIGLITFAFTQNFLPISFFDLAQTCPSLAQDCAFVRTIQVSAIPEVETWITFLVGFGAIGGAMRYRRRPTRVVLG
jgi:hypothetical protein